MPLRKSHQKSRFGCLNCKKRHIKCGEESPSCQNCINRRAPCVYNPIQASTETSSRASSSDTRSQAIAPFKPTACLCGHARTNDDYPIIVTRRQELHLMAHYIASTADTMSHGTGDIHIWQKVVPEDALHHEFLLDGLLALSSLHFAGQNPTSRLLYTEIAMHYQASALKRYKDALNDITTENRCALFAFSVLLNILALAFPNICSTPTESSHEESVMLLIELLQGMRFILQAPNVFHEELTKYEPLFAKYMRAIGPPKPSDDAASAILKLRERADSPQHSTDVERHQAYLSGIESLEATFGHVNEDPGYLGHIIAWPTTVGERLFALLKQEDPMAQLIFIHYGVLLLQTRHRWWGRNTGYRLIQGLARSISEKHPDWAGATHWATTTAAIAVQEDAS